MQNQPPILEHEILRILYKMSAHIIRNGNAEKGYVPIYKKDYRYGYLDYSYLVDNLNNPEKYIIKVENHAPMYYHGLIVKDHEIKIVKFSYEKISKALAILEFDEYISEDDKVVSTEMEFRTIKLTKKGELAFLKGFYLKERKINNYADELQNSVLTTNRTSRITAIIAVLFTIVIAIVAILQYKKSDPIEKSIQTMQTELKMLKTMQQKPDTVFLLNPQFSTNHGRRK